jgi:small subunit ribosomal protein S6
MRRYELMLLLRPDLEDDKLQAAVEKVTRAIVNAGGALSKVSPWGKRRLAYEIDRHREASYFLIHFDIEPSEVREIERGMLLSEEIMRHLVTVLEDRGPAEELPPAAAARTTDEPPADTASPAVPDDETADTPEDTSDDTGEDAPEDDVDDQADEGGEPADEERAEGDRPSAREEPS